MSLPLEEYALIGDCETAALVSRAGSIDWLCWPRFDSGACFAALLGDASNGRWALCPTNSDVRTVRQYRGDTMILETRHETAEGSVLVIDFMPLRDGRSDIVRTVVGLHGRVEMRTDIAFRFDYGSVVPWVSCLEDGTLRAVAGPDMIVVRGDTALHGESMTTAGVFALAEGERRSFVMTWGPSNLEPPAAIDAANALETTEKFWTDWSSHCTYRGEWRAAVIRSLLTLKALTYYQTGGLVAAPTTSLPELAGGSRNWDYRYCWLRDATLSLLALMNAGYYREAEAWRDWLLRAAAGSPDQVQIMYGLSGERLLREWDVPWLDGYAHSKPVRVGNAAHEQLQLDVYGEVMEALHQARLGDITDSPDAWALQVALAGHLSKIWRQPDQGIWEVRGQPQHFTHSKVMAWVAIDRAVKSAEHFNLHGPIEEWRAVRDEIHADICKNAFDTELNSFVQAYGSKLPDASVLLIPLSGFLPATDPRMKGTVAFIEKTLLVDGLVLRYDSEKTDDGLPPGEGTFVACSFWLADNYVMQGRRDEACALFERLLALRNDVGLLSEGYEPKNHCQVGNFPQAFSHIALLSTAFNLGDVAEQNAPRPAEQRGGTVPY
ncbi:MAG TPA: glycoside hydrolase family 15 protein [Gemmatimonadaceae bacterium]|jgi:GH15 family glucan-1,4-alpha-glucosidase